MDYIDKYCPQRRAHLTNAERMPRYLKETEKVLRTVQSCKSNFKTVLANSRLHSSIHKKVYSLSLNVLKNYNYIQKIIDEIHLLEKEKMLRREIASAVIYEIIFNKISHLGESKIISIIRAYENDILKVHQDLQRNGIDRFGMKGVIVPRYVRVHTLVTTVPYVIKDLEDLGFKQINYDSISEEKFLELVKNLETGYFLIDFHFKDILVFSSSENLTSLDLYEKRHIFLQDKASYIPVHALNPEPRCAILDACAAPGMKTLHIASKMKNKGLLIACERNKDRFEALKKMIHYGSVKICRFLCKDFKSLDPNDQAYSSIEYILLDPSCSGSGMISRMDEVTDTEDSKTKERLMNLARFQIILLKHALRFPSVKRVVYSTCSIHEEENEYVVQEALNSCYGAFKLVSVMPEWSDRGSENFEFGTLCLRAIPEKHMTNGFFVAMFERVDFSECNKRMNFPKNRKRKASTDVLHNESGSYSDFREHEESLYHIKQNDGNESKHFKSSSTSGLNQSPRDGKYSNLSIEESAVEHIDFDYKSSKPKKLKKKNKEKRENVILFQSGDDKELTTPNHKGILFDLHKENKHEFNESLQYHLKENDSSLSLKQSRNRKSAENVANHTSENTSKQYEENFHVAKEMSINFESNKMKKSKKKTKDKKKEMIYSQTNEELSEKLANVDSVVESISPEVIEIVENIETKEEGKHELKSHHSFESKPESKVTNLEVGLSLSEDSVSKCKDSKKHKHSKSGETMNIKHEVTDDFKNTVQTVCDSNDVFSSVENGFMAHKNKKHKGKKCKNEKTTNFEEINDAASCNFERTSGSAFIEGEHIQNKKSKKCKSRKHVDENNGDIKKVDESVSFNLEEISTTNTENCSVTKKKMCKSKSESKNDFEIIYGTSFQNPEQVSIPTENYPAVKKKNKKCKSKKHEVNEDLEKTNEKFLDEGNTSIENYPAVKEKNKKCKKHKVEGMDDSIMQKNEKWVSEKHLENSETALKLDSAKIKKSKKHKNHFQGSDNVTHQDHTHMVKFSCLLPKSEEELESILFSNF